MKLYAVKKFVKARNIKEAITNSYKNKSVQNIEITMEKDLTELKKELEKSGQIKVEKNYKKNSIGF